MPRVEQRSPDERSDIRGTPPKSFAHYGSADTSACGMISRISLRSSGLPAGQYLRDVGWAKRSVPTRKSSYWQRYAWARREDAPLPTLRSSTWSTATSDSIFWSTTGLGRRHDAGISRRRRLKSSTLRARHITASIDRTSWRRR